MAVHSQYHLILQGTSASRPASPAIDVMYFATDTGVLSVYDATGAAWTTIAGGLTTLPVSIANGGTGQTARQAAYDALSPNTTKGDIEVFDGTNNVSHTAGANYKLLVYDSTASDGIRTGYRNRSLTLFSAGLTKTYTTSPSYTAIFSTGTSNPTHTKLNLDGFREARLLSFGGIQAGSVSAMIKAVDTTNSKDITSLITFSSTTLSQGDSGWTALDASTYGGDIQLEIQAAEGSGGDVLRIDNLILEFR